MWLKENWETVRRGIDVVQGELYLSSTEYERITDFLKSESIDKQIEDHKESIREKEKDIEKASKL
jgi:virulence-associated protein VapD